MNKKESIKFAIAFMLLFGIMFFYGIGLINATSESLGTFKQDNSISLTQSCQNSTYSNITAVYYPSNSTYILKGEYQMTKEGNFYNYTLAAQDNLGIYNINGHCDVNGIDVQWAYTIELTSTGYTINTSKSIAMMIGIGIMVLLGILLFIFGLYQMNIMIKIFSIGLGVLIIGFSVGYGLNILNATIGEFSGLTNNFNSLYVLMTVLLTCGGIGLVVFLIYFSLNAFWKFRGFKD